MATLKQAGLVALWVLGPSATTAGGTNPGIPPSSALHDVDAGAMRHDAGSTPRGIGGPRRNKNLLAACLAAGEAGVAAREAFCRELVPKPLRPDCWSLTLQSIQKWQNWCQWWWG